MESLTLSSNATLSDCEHYSIMLCGVMEAVNHLENEGHSGAQVAVSEVAEAMMNQLSEALQQLSLGKRGVKTDA